MILLSRHTENASSPLSRLDGTNPSDEGLITGWGIGCNLGFCNLCCSATSKELTEIISL